MYDIFFISYKELNADKNWKALKARFPRATRVDGVKGIYNAHRIAAEKSLTKMFFVVDADAVIVESFDFNYKVDKFNYDTVHVWRSRNPINDLEYGYGAVKLLPKKKVLEMKEPTIDMTTSLSEKFCLVNEISNITEFNVDEYSTWKSAFRECVKLASKTIQGQVDKETEERLRVWTTAGLDRQFGDFAIRGAKEGMNFGIINRDNLSELSRINDFDWLHKRFSENNK